MSVLLVKRPFIGQTTAAFARLLPLCPDSRQEFSLRTDFSGLEGFSLSDGLFSSNQTLVIFV